MSTWTDLIAEVRAQVDVTDVMAYAWLLDRARVMNAESAWFVIQAEQPVDGGRDYALPADALWVEAVLFNGMPYQRSTLHAMDARWWGQTGNTSPIYADAVDQLGDPLLQIHPAPPSGTLTIRYVADVKDDRTTSPPFPNDFHEALVDGAVAIGLARMDERFDSANYLEDRFQAAIGRLRRRRSGHVGRGGVPIRVVM